MSFSLSDQMKVILKDGIGVVRKHQEFILPEWENIISQLGSRKGTLAKEMTLTVKLISDLLLSDDDSQDVKRFENIRTAWPAVFENPPEPNRMILIITILENAVHKAIETNIGSSYKEHQAVQYLFSQMTEHLLSYPIHKHLDLDQFLQEVTDSRQLPVEWAAKVTKSKEGYQITKMIGDRRSTLLDQKFRTLFSISEALLERMPKDETENQKVIPIPWEGEALLVCTKQSCASEVLPFLTFALELLTSGREALQFSHKEQQWKDSVILFTEWIMRSQNLYEAIENISFGFVNYLPFERCALFAYSDTEQKGFGLFGYHLNSSEIKGIKESIDNIPSIKKRMERLQLADGNLKNVQPLYFSRALDGFPDHYVREFHLESVVVAPIYVPSENKLIGAAILDQGPGKKFKLSQETFTALMKFGQNAGEILAKFGGSRPEKSNKALSIHLSRREIEVLKLMADGASTTEAADHLKLSEYTVRDYISAIMQKMDVRNRTEAVAKAIRGGII